MFALHETTRRRLCRAGFVLLCVVPTALTLGWIVWLRRPEYRDTVARQLSDRLGLTVKLAGVRHPRPEITLLDGVELLDPENGTQLAHVRLIEVNSAGDLPTVTLSQAEIDHGQWAPWWELAQRQLRRAPHGSSRLRLICGEVTLHMEGAAETLTDVRCQFESTDAASELACTFQMAGSAAPQPASLRIGRNRQTSPPTAAIEVQSGGADLSVGVLAAIWPQAARLGAHCRVRGSVHAVETAQGWDGELDGELSQVDLAELVSTQFPHKLSGRAQLQLEHVRFRGGRLEQCAGTLDAGPGLVGRALLKAAGEVLGFEPGGEIKTLGQSVPYEQFACAFAVDEHGLAVRGKCVEPAAGAILRDRSGPLLLEPQRASQPVVNLVRALVPHSDLQVPFTRQSGALLELLPTASPATATEAAALPAPRLRGLRRPEVEPGRQ